VLEPPQSLLLIPPRPPLHPVDGLTDGQAAEDAYRMREHIGVLERQLSGIAGWVVESKAIRSRQMP
jgi:hypothetical protein